MPDSTVSISTAADMLGVSISTLRRWDAQGRLRPCSRTPTGHRRYAVADLRRAARSPGPAKAPCDLTLAYVRGERADATAQAARMRSHCARQGWRCEVIIDEGAGGDLRRPGLRRLLSAIAEGTAARLLILRQGALARYGAELVLSACESCAIEVVILNEDGNDGPDMELDADAMHIIRCFAARLAGAPERVSDVLSALERAAAAAGRGDGA